MTYTKLPLGITQASPSDKNPLVEVPNKFLGGFKIYTNLTDMYHEPLEFLKVDNTFAVVKDKGNGKPGMYVLTSIPGTPPTTAPYTDATNWTLADLNDFVNGLDPQGTWDAGTFNPSTHPVDADAQIGHFYVVVNSANPTEIDNPAIFEGVATNVNDGDWILGNGTSFEVVPTLTPTLDQIRAADPDFNSRIAQIMDGGMPAHTHPATEVTTSKTVGATEYTNIEALLAVIIYTDSLAQSGNPATEQSKLWTYAQLSAIFKTESQIDTLIQNFIDAEKTGPTETTDEVSGTDLVTAAFLSFNFYNKTEIADQIAQAIEDAGGIVVMNEGTPLPSRTTHNYIGEGVIPVDDNTAESEKTDIYIPGYRFGSTTDGSTAGESYLVTLPIGMKITSHVEGMPIKVKFTTANTGNVDIDIDGLGAVSVVDSAGEEIKPGTIILNASHDVVYDGTKYVITFGGGGGSATTFRIPFEASLTISHVLPMDGSIELAESLVDLSNPIYETSINGGVTYITQANIAAVNVVANSVAEGSYYKLRVSVNSGDITQDDAYLILTQQ